MNAHAQKILGGTTTGQGRVPNGRYLMEIVESDAVSHGGTTDLVFTAEVMRGDHAGKKVAFRMRLNSMTAPDDDTVDEEHSGPDLIEYDSLCRATGLDNPTFVEDFRNRPFSALVIGRGLKQMLAGFEGPEFSIGPDNKTPPAPKQAKPAPARGPDGRFLPRIHAEAEAAVEQPEKCKPWEVVAAWTPEQRFMFDLEGELFKMVALAEILEALTTPLTNNITRHDRYCAAALDYASSNLVEAVRAIEERYMAVRFPEKAHAA